MSEDEDDDASKLAALQAELATLRLKAKEGGKLSGKDKRQLKKLEAAEERWKEYAAVAAPSADGDEGSSGGAIGSQFVATSDGGSAMSSTRNRPAGGAAAAEVPEEETPDGHGAVAEEHEEGPTVHLNLKYRQSDFNMTSLTCERIDRSKFDEQVREAQRLVLLFKGTERFSRQSSRKILEKVLAKCAFTGNYEAHLTDLKVLLSAADKGACFEYRYGGRAGEDAVLAYVSNHCISSKSNFHFEGVSREYDSGLGQGITIVPPPPPPHRFFVAHGGDGLLFVRNVPPATTEEELKGHFESSAGILDGTGGVEGVDFLGDSGRAMVKLANWSRADAFVQALDGSDFGGLQLSVRRVGAAFWPGPC